MKIFASSALMAILMLSVGSASVDALPFVDNGDGGLFSGGLGDIFGGSGSTSGGLFGNPNGSSDAGLFGKLPSGGFFKTVDDIFKKTNLGSVDLGKSDGTDPFKDVGFGGITIGDLTKKDRTQEDDLNLFLGGANIIADQVGGRDISKYTGLFGGLIGLLNKKGASDAGNVLAGASGTASADGGGGGSRDSLASGIAGAIFSQDGLVGALGAIVPDNVKAASEASAVGGTGGGEFGVISPIHVNRMAEYAEMLAISKGVDAQFSEEGQQAMAATQAGIEEVAATSADIAEQNQQAKASLDVSKGLSGQLAVLSIQENANFAEAVQNRMATTQTNKITAEIAKLQQREQWQDEISKRTAAAWSFNSAAGFSSLVEGSDTEGD